MARRPPGKTIEARERQLVSLAVDLAERQLEEGTAAPSVITHYLKLGATDYKLRLERLERENELLRARTHAVEREAQYEDIAKEAIEAIKRYSGVFGMEEVPDEML